MVTHQSLTGGTDDELLQRMVGSYAGRYNDEYWGLFDEHVRPRLSATPSIVDFGCGPGLFLQDVGKRVPGAALSGYDLTPAMIEYARGLDYGGAAPTLGVMDLLTDQLPMEEGSVDVASIAAVVHLFDDPFPVLDKIRRALKLGGTLLLYDWVRTSLVEYMERGLMSGAERSPEEFRSRSMKLFGVHNHYTADDWRWILAEAKFDVLAEAAPNGKYHRLFVTAPKEQA